MTSKKILNKIKKNQEKIKMEIIPEPIIQIATIILIISATIITILAIIAIIKMLIKLIKI